jgi:purine-binding chemotaxis protein CheW
MSDDKKRPGSGDDGKPDAVEKKAPRRSRRTASKGTKGEPSKKAPAPKVSLPSSGLADEILAHVEGRAPQGEPAPPAASETAGSPDAPDRLYRFADGLERKDKKAAEAPEQAETWVSFGLGEETFALPVSHVREVVRVENLTRVPHAPFPVRGITTLRGQIVTVVDLRQRLGLPAVELAPESRILVTASRGRTLGLLVDRARHVVRIFPSKVQVPPDDVMSEQSEYLAGVYEDGETLLILLDLDQVLLVKELGEATA